MKPALLALVFALATPAFAGGPVAPPVQPVPIVSPSTAAHDWSGAYVGLSYGAASGEVQFNPGSFGELGSGGVTGLLAGYLFQRGAFVFGGELAYGDVNDANFDSFEGIDTALDLKARLGFAANRALFYGVIGYSQANLYVDGGEWKMTGPAFGLGAEFALSDRMTLGLEYLSRDISGGESGGFPVDADSTLETISLRLSYGF